MRNVVYYLFYICLVSTCDGSVTFVSTRMKSGVERLNNYVVVKWFRNRLVLKKSQIPTLSALLIVMYLLKSRRKTKRPSPTFVLKW